MANLFSYTNVCYGSSVMFGLHGALAVLAPAMNVDSLMEGETKPNTTSNLLMRLSGAQQVAISGLLCASAHATDAQSRKVTCTTIALLSAVSSGVVAYSQSQEEGVKSDILSLVHIHGVNLLIAGIFGALAFKQ